MENYYELLNISPLASKEELEKAILKQQRLWHSRVNSADFERRVQAERMLRKLEEVQEVLLDDKKRETYNRNLLALVISSYRPETAKQNKTTDSGPEEKDEDNTLEEKGPSSEPSERDETTQESKKGDVLESPHKATIKDLSNEDDIVQEDQKEEKPPEDEKQEDQQDSVQKVASIGKATKSGDKKDNTNRTAEFVLGVIGGILGLILTFSEFLLHETFGFGGSPILLSSLSIAGMVGAMITLFHSNARIGGFIMAFAGIVLPFTATFILPGAIVCFPLLIAGLMGIFRKEAVSENKETHTFVTSRYNTRRTAEFILGVIGGFLSLILAFVEFLLYELTNETFGLEGPPILILSASIAGMVGVILFMFHSNAQIGGFITTIAGVVLALLSISMSTQMSSGGFASTQILPGAIASLLLLLAGLLGIFRKETVSGNKKAHTFLSSKYNPKRTAEFVLGVIGSILSLTLAPFEFIYYKTTNTSFVEGSTILEGSPILILSVSIAGIVGAILIMFHSNAQIGGIIMTIAGIVHLFAAIHIFLGAIASLPLLIAGFMGVFRKN